MERTTILEETTIGGFTDIGDGSAYYAILEVSFVFVAGETYVVHWDGTEHELTAVDNEGTGMVVSESEGFALISFVDQGAYGLQIMTTSAAARTLAIYQGEAEAVGIVLKDRNGEDRVYYRNMIRLNKSDGSKAVFSEGEAVENVPVTLDFSGGDQVVAAPAGTLVKSAVIQKPDTLIPENIVEGVDIAGIIGALSKGKDIKFNHGTLQTTDKFITVSHGLGVVPDIIFLKAAESSASSGLFSACGMRTTLMDAIGWTVPVEWATYQNSSASFSASGFVVGVDYASAGTPPITQATENTFVAGSNVYKLKSNIQYDWFAIGGLT